MAPAVHNTAPMQAHLALVRTEPPSGPATLAVPAQNAFELEDVSRRFGPRWALCRVSYSLPAGRSLLLTGHNGSGKTTLLRVLATSYKPSAGTLRVFGMDSQKQTDAIRRKVALLSHANALYDDLSAAQNLTLLARLLDVEDPRTKVQAILDRVGLGKREGQAVRTFSAGMKKRLAIGRMLLKRPELVLLDEPFGELDPAGIEQMEGIIGELRAGGTTLVLATHLIEQGERLCQDRLHLEDGWMVTP